MFNLSYEFNYNIPVFKSNFCGKCSDILESASFLDVKMRGCCWYFPKYTLVDIKNIISQGRTDFIYFLLKHPASHISQYYIEVKGRYDSKSHLNYLLENECTAEFDSRLFFRLCPFFGSKGCSIEFSLRPHPCNLYLCRTMIKNCGDSYNAFSKERRDYYSYCNYYNESIKQEMLNMNTDLLTDPTSSLTIINEFTMPDFQPRKLDKLIFTNATEEDIAI